MKKPSSKSPKPTTPPAARPVSAVAPKAASVAAKPARTIKSQKVAVAPSVAEKPATKAAAPTVVVAPVVEPVAVTTVLAQTDIGFGNTLFIRGEGAGLSWDKGLAMDNVAADQWRMVLPAATQPVVFKLLINDLTWSTGEDSTVAVGGTITVTPTF